MGETRVRPNPRRFLHFRPSSRLRKRRPNSGDKSMTPEPGLIQSIDRLTAALGRVDKTLHGIILARYGSSLAAAKITSAKTNYERNEAINQAEKLVRGVIEEIEAVEGPQKK